MFHVLSNPKVRHLGPLPGKGLISVGIMVTFSIAGGASAAHRFVRRFDETSGLKVATVVSLTQDRAGFLWLGTHGGLVRFDGHGFESWAREWIPGTISKVLARPEGGILKRCHPS